MNLCFKCIELAVKHGKDTIEAVQPGVKMDLEAAKAVLETLQDDDDSEEQADAEEVDDTTTTQRKAKGKAKSGKSESAKVTAEDAEIADLKRQNDLSPLKYDLWP